MQKLKNKILFQTKENIWNNKKVLKLKKQKWEFIIKKWQVNNKKQNFNFKSKKKLLPESLKKLYKSKLIEKQKLQKFYGNLSQGQLKTLFSSLKKKKSKTIINDLCILLETRLDILLYRLSIIKTIFEVKFLIKQNLIYVNNIPVKSSSYNVKVGDLIYLNYNSFKIKNIVIPSYIEFNKKLKTFVLLNKPKINNIKYPFDLNLNLVFKYLNNK